MFIRTESEPVKSLYVKTKSPNATRATTTITTTTAATTTTTTATTTTTTNKQTTTDNNKRQIMTNNIKGKTNAYANDHLEGPASCKWSSGGSSLLQMNIQRGRPLACVGVLTPTATIFNGTLETTSVEEIQILICAKSNQRRPGLHSVTSLVRTSIC